MASTLPAATPQPQFPQPQVYEGQFGPYTINSADRRGVYLYRAGLALAALCFAAGVSLVLGLPQASWPLTAASWLYSGFWLALGVSLLTIHIYLRPLHRALQVCWVAGGLASLGVAHQVNTPFVQTVYDHPLTLWGVGFTFVALTGIYFKEAFCFNRLETKALTPLVPLLLLGHLFGILPVSGEKVLLGLWATLFLIFALRKLVQTVPDDIGDKSVFDYLERAGKKQEV